MAGASTIFYTIILLRANTKLGFWVSRGQVMGYKLLAWSTRGSARESDHNLLARFCIAVNRSSNVRYLWSDRRKE